MNPILFNTETEELKVKGKKNGLCNRTACQSPNDVVWYNSGTYAYYCPKCAKLINNAGRGTLGYDLCVEQKAEKPCD